jgi:hypothetical protein
VVAIPDHRIVIEWMGESIETLEDLLRPGLDAVCVGINPTPPASPRVTTTRAARAGASWRDCEKPA